VPPHLRRQHQLAITEGACPAQPAHQIAGQASDAGAPRVPYRAAALADILTLLHQQNAQAIRLGQLQRRKNSGRASADDNDIVFPDRFTFFRFQKAPRTHEKAEIY
jgi:hypothetical protein